MSSARAPASKFKLLQVIDWRLVAAIGLPLWAFIIGIVVARSSSPRTPAPQPVEFAELVSPTGLPEPAPAPPAPSTASVESIPAPREVVVRTEVVTVPVAVPILSEPVAIEPAAPVEFKLPAAEVVPADRCKTFDTKVRFHAGLPEAAEDARQSKKMLLVLHISGNFDDPGFT